MSRKKLSRNAPCPCGSGKKFKHCCFGQFEDDVGPEYHAADVAGGSWQ